MDGHLKLLAEVGLAVTEAEAAAERDETAQARDALERADAALRALRGAWPAMRAAERVVIGPTAAPLSARADATRARLPTRSALSVGTPERDPDEEIDPAQAA